MPRWWTLRTMVVVVGCLVVWWFGGEGWLVVVVVAKVDRSMLLTLGTRQSSSRKGIAHTKEGLGVYNDLNANTIPSNVER